MIDHHKAPVFGDDMIIDYIDIIEDSIGDRRYDNWLWYKLVINNNNHQSTIVIQY